MRRDPGIRLRPPSTLLRVQTEDGELDAAENTLEFLRRHQPGPVIQLPALRLAAKREDPARARQALVELIAAPPAPGSGDGGLSDAVKIMSDAGWRTGADEVLREALRLPAGSGHPEAGETLGAFARGGRSVGGSGRGDKKTGFRRGKSPSRAWVVTSRYSALTSRARPCA